MDTLENVYRRIAAMQDPTAPHDGWKETRSLSTLIDVDVLPKIREKWMVVEACRKAGVEEQVYEEFRRECIELSLAARTARQYCCQSTQQAIDTTLMVCPLSTWYVPPAEPVPTVTFQQFVDKILN